jgi:hypothetical protein
MIVFLDQAHKKEKKKENFLSNQVINDKFASNCSNFDNKILSCLK